MNRDAFIYAWADKSAIRYVGSTVRPILREREHRRRMGDSNTATLDLSECRLIYLEAVPEADRRSRECFWVQTLGNQHPLVNRTWNPSRRRAPPYRGSRQSNATVFSVRLNNAELGALGAVCARERMGRAALTRRVLLVYLGMSVEARKATEPAKQG